MGIKNVVDKAKLDSLSLALTDQQLFEFPPLSTPSFLVGWKWRLSLPYINWSFVPTPYLSTFKNFKLDKKQKQTNKKNQSQYFLITIDIPRQSSFI